VHRIQVGLEDSSIRQGVDHFSERFFNAETDENGRFEFKGIPAGEYLLYVVTPRRGPIAPGDLTYYPNVRDSKAATVIKLGESQRVTGVNIRMVYPRQRTP